MRVFGHVQQQVDPSQDQVQVMVVVEHKQEEEEEEDQGISGVIGNGFAKQR